MPLSQDDPTAFRRQVSMLGLVGAHLLIGLVLGMLLQPGGGYPGLPHTFFVGLAFAQASLLGVWAGLGAGPWWRRLIGLVVGSGCLGVEAETCIGLRDLDWWVFFFLTFAAVAVAITLTVVRCFGFRIGLPTTECNATTGIQFGIRHLLVLTVLVSAMLALGRKLPFSLFDELLTLAITSLPCVVIGALSPWAILGKRHLVTRGVVFLVVAAAAGCALALLIDLSFLFWIVVALTEAGFLIISLLVVRLCGYRLVRLCKMRVGQEHP